MNKTLLLILVDFLLLTILSMTKWDEERSEQEASSQASDEVSSVSAMGMMEQDLLDTLKSSLEEEKSQQLAAAEAAALKQQELEAARQALEERDALIQEKEQSVQNLETVLEKAKEESAALAQQRADLNENLADSRSKIGELEKRYQDLQLAARQTEEQSRQLQEELERKALEIQQKEKALAEAELEKMTLAEKSQELQIQVRVAEEEKRYLKENVDTLKGQVVAERQENRKLQEQAGKLAEGVTQLAEKSENLREELRSSIPINANQIFDNYLSQRVEVEYTVQRFSRGRVLEEKSFINTVLVSDGESVVALAHLDNSPFDVDRNVAGFRNLSSQLIAGGDRYEMDRVQFLALDPRMAALPVDQSVLEKYQDIVYLTALEPFKFNKAVLINANGNYYGEVEFKLDADTPGYVTMQSKIFNRLFGEFSPSTGDLVFSKTGELLGIMVDRSRCVLIDTFIAWESLEIGTKFSNDKLGEVMASLKNRNASLPAQLR